MVLKSSQRRQPFLPLKESIEFFTLRSSLFPSKGVSLFLPFYLFTFLPLKSAAGNSERSSDGCKDGDCNLQNRFPSICFHNV